MKIKLTNVCFLFRKRPLMILMRTFIFLLCTTMFSLTPENTFSQSKVVIDADKEVSIDQVFNIIKQQTDYTFVYQQDIFKNTPKVQLKKGTIRVDKLLNQSIKLKDFNIILTNDNTIVVKKKKQSQQKQVTGKVTDDSGLPIAGATILIKGTTRGTTTDFDGAYNLIVADAANVLVYSSLGFKTQEITVGNQTVIDVTLQEDVSQLDEVTLTYHGVTKEKKALGFGVSTVKSEEISNKAEVDLASTLQGKISGIQIIQESGATGAPATILIRSSLSITDESGGNGALIILDDVPFAGNLLNIDPNDIKDITILKGLSAAILYGTDGRNGVVIVETFSGNPTLGERKVSIELSRTDYTVEVAGLPEFQNSYGPGFLGGYSNRSRFSWGPAFNTIESVNNPLLRYPEAFPDEAFTEVPYEAAPNNIKDIYGLSFGNSTSLRLSSSQESTAFNFSMGHAHEEGAIGNNSLDRFSVGTSGIMKFGDKLELQLSINGTSTKTNSQDGGEVFSRLLFLPRNIDLFSFPFENPLDGSSVFYDTRVTNPLWLLKNSLSKSERLSAVSNFSFRYKINDNINANYRLGVNIGRNDGISYKNKGEAGNAVTRNGFLGLSNSSSVGYDQRLVINADYELNDKIGFSGSIGMQSEVDASKSSSASYLDQIARDVFRPNNFTEHGLSDSYRTNKRNLLGVYSNIILDYDDYVFLSLSGRNDWTSTLEKNNRSVFYPSFSIAFHPVTAFNIRSRALNSLKLRASLAESVGYPAPYRTRTDFDISRGAFFTPDGEIITNTANSFLPNLALRSEIHQELEFGIEGAILNNRVSFEASLYYRKSFDQLTNIPIDPSNGYTNTLANIGQVNTDGFELDLTIDLFDTKDFAWQVRNTFSTFKSVIAKLGSDESFSIGGGRGIAEEGQPLGSVVGTYALRDSEGNFLIDPNDGKILVSQDVGFNSSTINSLPDKIIGNRDPEWTASTINTIKYKDFTLSAQLEYVKGGTDFSDYAFDLLEAGVTRDTENRDGSFVINGVVGDETTGLPVLDENGQTIPSSIQVPADASLITNYYRADDNSVFDLSVFRIREIALNYDVNTKSMKNSPFDKLSFKLTGRNLFYYAPGFPKYLNVDPSISSSSATTFSSTKRFSLSILASF